MKTDKTMILFWLFEAQYNICAQMEGTQKYTAKHIFKDLWSRMKMLAKVVGHSVAELEIDKGLEEDAAADDLFNSGEAVLQFCEVYMKAEEDGCEQEFIKYLNKFAAYKINT